MSVHYVVVDRRVIDTIGEAAIKAACAQLWPIDCVLCGWPLGTDPPELWLNSAPEGWDVALCHPQCTPPYGELPATLAGFSWRATALLAGGTPTVLLNPSAERVRLARTSDSWQVRPDLLYPGTGLKMSEPGFVVQMNEPLRLAPLHLTAARVEVRMGGDTFAAHVNTQIAESIRNHDGCFLIITHGVWADPELNADDIMRVLDTGQAAIGWAGMDSAAHRALGEGLTAVRDAVAANVVAPASDGGHWLLRLAPGEQAVVQQLASSPVAEDGEIQAWATRHLREEARLLPWRAWGADHVIRRWQTQDVLTGTSYALIVHTTDARLYRELSSARPPDDGGDEEAFSWAGRVLGRSSRWTELSPTGRIRWFAEVPQ